MFDKMPQIITSNLTPKIVDKVFRLFTEITDSQVKDDRMYQFGVAITDNDGRSRNPDIRKVGILAINNSYSKLSLLQKKIVNRTFEIVIMSSDTNIVLKKYLYEIEKLISKHPQ